VLNRLILGWLKAGVLREGEWEEKEEGTPQGGIVSPLLANLYLHEVLDTWFEDEVKPRLKGRAQLVRYADDAVLCFECKEDATRVYQVLEKRLARYGLTLHPEKTRMVDFRPPPAGKSDLQPRSFSFLGFTFLLGKEPKREVCEQAENRTQAV
jgi:RNA-directed DNA polymerase